MNETQDDIASNSTDGKRAEDQLKFEEFCKLCEKIESRKTKNEKKKVIRDFINWWKKNSDTKSNETFYAALRLLCPSKDIKRTNPTTGLTEGRGSYGIKVDKMRIKYFNVLQLNKSGEDGKKLLHFKEGSVNDFAEVLYGIMKTRSRKNVGSITISELNHSLDRIAVAFADGRQKDADDVFDFLIKNTTALENKWLVRIILKEMKMGLGENSILFTFHPDAKEYYENTHSLVDVCRDLPDPQVPLSVRCIKLFMPFSPMLSDRVNMKSIESLIHNKTRDKNFFYIEVKYDGERFQIHMEGETFKFFSRNSNDFSDAFNESLTPFIKSAFVGVKNCILDGEMLGYESAEDRIITKSDHDFDVKKLKFDPENSKHPLFIAFDIVLLNDEVLTAKPLSERLEILKKFIKPVAHRIEFAERIVGSSKEDAVDALSKAIDQREEGIIIKLPDSFYKTNVRKGGGWFKLKPDYVHGLVKELDLLIVGGSYGARGGISHFLVAVGEKESEESHPHKFVALAWVGTGYTNDELRELQTKLKDLWKPLDKKKLPNMIEFGKIKPDVWIEPKNSVILEIKAAEIMENDDYRTQFTLRFPRVERIRDDKPWHQCMTRSEIEDLKSQGTLASNIYDDDLHNEPEKKRRKIMGPTPSSLQQMVNSKDVEVSSQLFKDKEFCVTPIIGESNHTKKSLETLIIEHGGKITGIPFPGKTYCVVAQNINSPQVKNYIKCGKYNVVKPEWLLKCIHENEIIEWTPDDLWNPSNKTKAQFEKLYDKFGDSFLQNVNGEQLKHIFSKIDLKENLLQSFEIADIEAQLNTSFPPLCNLGLFRDKRFYVDLISDNFISKHNLLLAQAQVRFYGATIVDTMDEMPSYIIVDDCNQERVHYYHSLKDRSIFQFDIVNRKWINDCIESNRIELIPNL